MDGGAFWAAVHGVVKNRTRLSDFTFTFHFHALEKEMAAHSSVLAWRIPGMGEPGGLPSMQSHRVGHDWSDLAAAAAGPWGLPWQLSCKESTWNTGECSLIPGLGRSSGEGTGYPLQYSWAPLVAQLVKNLPAMRETWVWPPSLGRSPGEGKGYPLQYSGLKNSMDCIVHEFANNW